MCQGMIKIINYRSMDRELSFDTQRGIVFGDRKIDILCGCGPKNRRGFR